MMSACGSNRLTIFSLAAIASPWRTRRSVVCPAKAGVFSRRKACRGKSQKPRSLDSRVAGNQASEAYRQRLPREDDESPGRNDSERKRASKVRSPEGRVLDRRAKAAWGAEI